MDKENLWAKYAENFEDLNNYVVGKNDMAIIKQAVSEIKDLGQVLELACGDGAYTKIIAKNAQNVLATDLCEKMVQAASAKLDHIENIKVEQANCLHLSYNNESFDAVFMANILHVTSDYNKALSEACRVLKPNGKIIILDLTTDGMTLLNKLKMIWRYLKTYGKPSKDTQKPKFSLKEMVYLVQEKNLNVKKSQLLGEKSKAVFVVAQK